MRVVFPFLGQAHQVLHALPIAAAMAERYPSVEVQVAAVKPALLDFARRLAAQHAPRAPLVYTALRLGPGDAWRMAAGQGRTHFKQYTLLSNRAYFAGFDAVVAPERTSLFLKKLGLRAKLVWTRHGAGDREVGFADDVGAFDFVLMSGRKIERRLLDGGLIRPGAYVSGVYAKFDWARAAPGAPLFANGRRTVLYNPHFRSKLSSWPALGRGVLETLARSTRYNLVFAPHVRLFDPPREADQRAFADYAALDHLRIDLGSERSIDMSYTQGADLYLGDVSSQVAEFVSRPRPCLMLDAHATAWQGKPSYQSWTLGAVRDTVEGLEDALDQAFENQARYAPLQRAYLDETFNLPPGPSAPRGADAIVEFLQRAARRDTGAAALGVA